MHGLTALIDTTSHPEIWQALVAGVLVTLCLGVAEVLRAYRDK